MIEGELVIRVVDTRVTCNYTNILVAMGEIAKVFFGGASFVFNSKLSTSMTVIVLLTGFIENIFRLFDPCGNIYLFIL